MAWNDSNDNNRDPWGGRRNEQGPPDLDEVVRKMQEKLGGLFGGRPRGPQRTGSGETPKAVWAVLAVVVVAALVYEMFWRIQPAERGLVLRFGRHVATLQPGPHFRFPRPIENVLKVNVDQIRAFTVDSSILTRDENIVDIQFAVQYRISNVEDYVLRIADPDESVQRAAESAIRETIGTSAFDFIITEGRAEIASQVVTSMQQMLDTYQSGIAITSVNMQPATPPEEVKSSFDDAIKAREDEQRKINEAEAYRNEIVERSQGEAARVRLEAEAYREQVVAQAEGEARRFEQLLAEYELAPEVTRERLYLETVEKVLGASTKVVMDVPGNNVLLMPLDKLIGTPSRALPDTSATAAPTTSADDFLSPVDPARERAAGRARSMR